MWEGPGVRDQGLSQPCPHSLAVVTLDPVFHSPVPESPIPHPWPCVMEDTSPVPAPSSSLPSLSFAEPTLPHRYLVPNSGPEQSLVSKSLCAFVREVGARSAAPGGGSVAAASAAMVSARQGARDEDRARGAWPGVPSLTRGSCLA